MEGPSVGEACSPHRGQEAEGGWKSREGSWHIKVTTQWHTFWSRPHLSTAYWGAKLISEWVHSWLSAPMTQSPAENSASACMSVLGDIPEPNHIMCFYFTYFNFFISLGLLCLRRTASPKTRWLQDKSKDSAKNMTFIHRPIKTELVLPSTSFGWLSPFGPLFPCWVTNEQGNSPYIPEPTAIIQTFSPNLLVCCLLLITLERLWSSVAGSCASWQTLDLSAHVGLMVRCASCF